MLVIVVGFFARNVCFVNFDTLLVIVRQGTLDEETRMEGVLQSWTPAAAELLLLRSTQRHRVVKGRRSRYSNN